MTTLDIIELIFIAIVVLIGIFGMIYVVLNEKKS